MPKPSEQTQLTALLYIRPFETPSDFAYRAQVIARRIVLIVNDAKDLDTASVRVALFLRGEEQ